MSNTLQDLRGEEVSGICFVHDYLELRFDGPILRALSRMAVENKIRKVWFGDLGFRDLVCELIGTTVLAGATGVLLRRTASSSRGTMDSSARSFVWPSREIR